MGGEMHDHEDDEELEPPWPGWRTLVSGRAGAVAVVLVIVVGFWAYRMVAAQQRYNAPSNTQTVCIPISYTPTAPGSVPVSLPAVCVTAHG
ncbi:CO dehydrogenase/acetyl-CoA synthase epsilon subunit [Catenulispora sp. MAP5-51]